MNKKTIISLSVLFIGFLLISVQPWISDKLKKTSSETTIPSDINFDEYNQDDVESFVIEKNDSFLQFKKEAGTWKLGVHNVSEEEINSFFEALGNTEITALASKNKENHENFATNKESGMVLKLKVQDGEETIYVGKTGTSYGTFYVLKEDSQKIFLAEGNLRNKMIQSEDVWRDKVITRLNVDEVEKIVVKSAKTNVEITKDESGSWIKTKNGKKIELDEEAKSKISEQLKEIAAVGFLNEQQMKEFPAAWENITFSVFDASNEVLLKLTMGEKNQQYWTKKDKEEYGYVLSKDSLDSIVE